MNFGTPVFMTASGAGNAALVMIVTMLFSFALMTGVFFFLKWNHKRKHPTDEDVKETNRQRREREKLQRQTTEKVNAYMSGKKAEGEKEHVPNGKRCGKYKKKNKKK